jgi:hypothetical protein
MPQFDSYSYSSQVFLILLGFYLLYFFVLNYYLVCFSEVFKMRQKLLFSFLQEKNKIIDLVDTFSPYFNILLGASKKG